jgi:hypothetical protein
VVQSWLLDAAQNHNIIADNLLKQLYHWVSNPASSVHHPVLHKALLELMQVRVLRDPDACWLDCHKPIEQRVLHVSCACGSTIIHNSLWLSTKPVHSGLHWLPGVITGGVAQPG